MNDSLRKNEDRHFPLKRYYLIYGGVGSLLFYILLFMLFINAERQALYDEYAHNVSDKARSLFMGIERDFLKPHQISIDQIGLNSLGEIAEFRKEIALAAVVFDLKKVKLFRVDGLTLYDHTTPDNEGLLYASRYQPGFIAAAYGEIHSEIEVEKDGRRFMEAYLPIQQPDTDKVIAILEIYEDVSRFDRQVQAALQQAIALPTLVFLCFNFVLFMIVARADRIIADHTHLLVSIRWNMEKYLSQSAVTAIYQAVSESKELFRGERQPLVIFFSDIRGFTAYSESTEPEQVVEILNEIFEIQADIIHQQGGVIDKFVGDEIMAIFTAGQEANAVRAAINILKAIDQNPNVNQSVGIGIHSGEAVVGSLGTKTRRDYTAIGDTINTGARLCAACPSDNLFISDTVFKNLPLNLQAKFSSHDALKLKGKAELFSVHLLKG
ncbi:MAG: Guanylate cyclase protein [Pseudomonadota bacterium]|nr:Guanylate cyclase protein [Pseudomonadota bacterium]